jgi:hypothetical protein
VTDSEKYLRAMFRMGEQGRDVRIATGTYVVEDTLKYDLHRVDVYGDGGPVIVKKAAAEDWLAHPLDPVLDLVGFSVRFDRISVTSATENVSVADGTGWRIGGYRTPGFFSGNLMNDVKATRCGVSWFKQGWQVGNANDGSANSPYTSASEVTWEHCVAANCWTGYKLLGQNTINVVWDMCFGVHSGALIHNLSGSNLTVRNGTNTEVGLFDDYGWGDTTETMGAFLIHEGSGNAKLSGTIWFEGCGPIVRCPTSP